MRGKRFVAWALGALMVLAPLSACSQQQAGQDAGEAEEEMTRDFEPTGEVAKDPETNPLKAYDKYWDLHFNFDTQGYYLRQSYRSDIEYELKRAFGLMEVYYNIFDPYTKGIYTEYNAKLWKALDQMDTLGRARAPRTSAPTTMGTMVSPMEGTCAAPPSTGSYAACTTTPLAIRDST